MERINKVGVIGLGVMGLDIAFLYAMKGFRTWACDSSSVVMRSVSGRVEKTLASLKKRQRITDAEAENAQSGITATPDLQAMAELDLITEAIIENESAKRSVYRTLRQAGFRGILTTNTSSLPLSTLTGDDGYDPPRTASTHFFNPVLYTRMVEVVRGQMTETRFLSLTSFLEGIGRNPVETRDISGYVSNSILMYTSIMALHLMDHGGRIEDIDSNARDMGLSPPFFSFDRWRPSIVEDVTRVMHQKRGDAFLRSSELLSALAQHNPKFYTEREPNVEVYRWVKDRHGSLDSSIIQTSLRASLFAAAARVVELGEEVPKTDVIAVEGLRLPWPPLREMDRIGIPAVLDEIEKSNSMLTGTRLDPPTILLAMAREGQTFYKNHQANPWITSYLQGHGAHAGH